MAEGRKHIIRKGDTLYKLARQNHIRYWPNIYFATENSGFRKRCLNPDRIFENDVVYIPLRASIAPMEAHPRIVYRNIPLFTQTADTCWRATGMMLYANHKQVPDAVSKFNNLIGPEYKNRITGLQSHEWHHFYCMRLGMKEALISSPNDLHYIIASYGPAIVAIGSGGPVHSMVMAGYDLFLGKWLVLDPAAGEHLQFEDEVINIGGKQTASQKSQNSQESATLTGYKTAAATWKNMHRWFWILETTVHQKVYYYR